jgi:hypothetical protein
MPPPPPFLSSMEYPSFLFKVECFTHLSTLLLEEAAWTYQLSTPAYRIKLNAATPLPSAGSHVQAHTMVRLNQGLPAVQFSLLIEYNHIKLVLNPMPHLPLTSNTAGSQVQAHSCGASEPGPPSCAAQLIILNSMPHLSLTPQALCRIIKMNSMPHLPLAPLSLCRIPSASPRQWCV